MMQNISDEDLWVNLESIHSLSFDPEESKRVLRCLSYFGCSMIAAAIRDALDERKEQSVVHGAHPWLFDTSAGVGDIYYLSTPSDDENQDHDGEPIMAARMTLVMCCELIAEYLRLLNSDICAEILAEGFRKKIRALLKADDRKGCMSLIQNLQQNRPDLVLSKRKQHEHAFFPLAIAGYQEMEEWA